jgi:hypothetical protein
VIPWMKLFLLFIANGRNRVVLIRLISDDLQSLRYPGFNLAQPPIRRTLCWWETMCNLSAILIHILAIGKSDFRTANELLKLVALYLQPYQGRILNKLGCCIFLELPLYLRKDTSLPSANRKRKIQLIKLRWILRDLRIMLLVRYDLSMLLSPFFAPP